MKTWVLMSWRHLALLATHGYARFAWLLPLIFR